MNLAQAHDWFRGRTALVTGGSSGVGRAIAVALGRAGASVGVNYRRNAAGAEEVRREIESAGGRAVSLQADVGDERQVERMVVELVAAFGERIDLLVNNAGEWMDPVPLLECSLEQWERSQAVNARSVFLCCRAVGKRMKERKEGSIVNLGSVAGHTGGGGGTIPYAAAKAAVHTLTRGLAKELGPHGVRVNAVAPGMVDTPMLTGRVSPEASRRLQAATPLGRMSLPDEIVPMVMLLLSPAGSFVTGQVIDANGGLLMR